MKYFTYWDNSQSWHGKKLCTILASCIEFADEHFKIVTGLGAFRCPWVSCLITKKN